MSTQLIEWKEEEFTAAQQEKGIAVVEFGAPWCAACKMTEPAVAAISADYPNVKFAKVDVATNPALAAKMGVMSLPNILILVDGKIKEQIIGGANRAKIEEKLKKFI
ncbi:MAG: thioredoxin family protein [Candidatus Berkelbacteria bacterium]